MSNIFLAMDKLATDVLYISIAVAAFAVSFAILWFVFQSIFKKKASAEKPEITSLVIKDAVIQAEVSSERIKEPNFFALSRIDIFDHTEVMNGNKARFPVKIDIKENKQDETLPDYLLCGGRCFAEVFGRNNLVFSLILRLDKEFAKQWKKDHYIENVNTSLGNDLYHLVIDNSYKNKQSVYYLLDSSYDYVVKKFFIGGQDNIETAKAEFSSFEKEAPQKASILEPSLAESEKNYLTSLQKFRIENSSKFIITRREIAEDTRNLKNPSITVSQPASPQFPTSLKWKGKTYAMLYASEMSVLMIVRISDEYANELSQTHPEVYRAVFPKGSNWYVVQIDGAFPNKESVYEVLTAARLFVQSSKPGKGSVAKKTVKKPATPKKPS